MTFYNPPNPVGQTVGSTVPGFTGSFVDPKFIDPTLVDANNPTAIPASPLTGNRAIIVFDSSGGGNNGMSSQVFNTTQGGFRISAYFDTSALPQQTNSSGAPIPGSELTTFGLGGSDSVVNATDLAGNVKSITPSTLPTADNSNGLTGVHWVYERTAVDSSTSSAATANLYLVDAKDGGDSDFGGNTPIYWDILHTIPLANVASDWYDLGISVDAAGIGVAYFNGTAYNFTTSTDMHSGAFNVGYREVLNQGATTVPLSIMRPATFTIPEPGSLVLLGLAGMVAFGVRRQR
jgi:hypothetical protein